MLPSRIQFLEEEQRDINLKCKYPSKGTDLRLKRIIINLGIKETKISLEKNGLLQITHSNKIKPEFLTRHLLSLDKTHIYEEHDKLSLYTQVCQSLLLRSWTSEPSCIK